MVFISNNISFSSVLYSGISAKRNPLNKDERAPNVITK